MAHGTQQDTGATSQDHSIAQRGHKMANDYARSRRE